MHPPANLTRTGPAGFGVLQLDTAGNGLPGSASGPAADFQTRGVPNDGIGQLRMLGSSGPQRPTAPREGVAFVGGPDPLGTDPILVPNSGATFAQPQGADSPGGVNSDAGGQHYTGAIAEYRESGNRPTCLGAIPAEEHVAAISRLLSTTLDPTCAGSANRCTWCNRPALVTGPAGSAVVHLFDEVSSFATSARHFLVLYVAPT